MKLKIKNLDKIKGAYQKLWIEDVTEMSDLYIFHCQRRGQRTTTYNIVLSREGHKDQYGDWVYHFYAGREKTQCVTPGWFQNIGNALSAVVSEFDSQYGL